MTTRTATKADLANLIRHIAAVYANGHGHRELGEVILNAAETAMPFVGEGKPANGGKVDLRINAERWLSGEPSAKEPKRRKDRQPYQPFIVTFADGSQVRTGTYDAAGGEDVFMLRQARCARMQVEFRRLERQLPRAWAWARHGTTGPLERLQSALGWHWTHEPTGWHCTRTIDIPALANVEPVRELRPAPEPVEPYAVAAE